MEWVQRDGGMYLVPVKRESRINSFRHWEQAFHLYASIYCDKHLFRAKEMWQYISVIQTASSAYIWENVYGYDIVLIIIVIIIYYPHCVSVRSVYIDCVAFVMCYVASRRMTVRPSGLSILMVSHPYWYKHQIYIIKSK